MTQSRFPSRLWRPRCAKCSWIFLHFTVFLLKKVEELLDDWVSADEIVNIRLRLANISSALQDEGGEDEMLQVKRSVSMRYSPVF